MEKKPRKNRGLGRGLSALMADVSTDSAEAETATAAVPEHVLPIEALEPNPDQPRKDFSQEALQDLAASIREKGVIQPLIVRRSPRDGDRYEIVAGERRWRAAQIAQLHEIPVLLREFDDSEVLEIAIIENVQRADLNPIEEALGYRQLTERFGHTQERLAQALGKSRSHIANVMRLLQLPDEVQGYLRNGRLSAGHARALITAEAPADLARQVISKGLSVRETEALATRSTNPKGSGRKKLGRHSEKDADTRALESDLSANLRMKVSIEHLDVDGSGRMVIQYRSLDQLDALCQRLSAGPLDELP
ncbi:ParB/RepB/Spo0J family partition protein [Tropicimonas sp. IMCC6043]|uniref:ParB/RepB/Spo0J family partition protein n=1 Tax=Tropicimonas sp. IMCC6043 TaxID=2510645 RepID=UPI00101D7A19|nr:ParB/RepB/Spo0J family partition protein [Tropicimonas sp. IMCC6043]RYH10866.1 ParB/RepB/Spo0J family partition protein [Tropicimonas sp. IMCC6043]